MVNFLYESKWWQASQGRDHVVVLHHPNSFRFFPSIGTLVMCGQISFEVVSLLGLKELSRNIKVDLFLSHEHF